MLDQRPNPFVMTDRAIAESGDDDAKGDYLQMVAELEATAHRVLAEQGLSHRAVSIQALVSDDLELSDRASKAMSVLISIRLLKLREQDAIRGGQATARTFYHVAQNAMIAAVVAALISPMMTDQDAEIAKGKRGPKRGGETRAENFASRDDRAKSTLLALWKGGARFKVLKEWSGAIFAELPEIAPSKDQTFTEMNRKVSRWGKEAFGAEWSVPQKRNAMC